MCQKTNNPNMRQHVRVFSRVQILAGYELPNPTRQTEPFQGTLSCFFMGGATNG